MNRKVKVCDYSSSHSCTGGANGERDADRYKLLFGENTLLRHNIVFYLGSLALSSAIRPNHMKQYKNQISTNELKHFDQKILQIT